MKTRVVWLTVMILLSDGCLSSPVGIAQMARIKSFYPIKLRESVALDFLSRNKSVEGDEDIVVEAFKADFDNDKKVELFLRMAGGNWYIYKVVMKQSYLMNPNVKNPGIPFYVGNIDELPDKKDNTWGILFRGHLPKYMYGKDGIDAFSVVREREVNIHKRYIVESNYYLIPSVVTGMSYAELYSTVDANYDDNISVLTFSGHPKEVQARLELFSSGE